MLKEPKQLTKDRMNDIEKIVAFRMTHFQDSLETRLAVLHELRDEWLQDVLVSEDFDRYLIAIEIMISKTMYQIMLAKK